MRVDEIIGPPRLLQVEFHAHRELGIPCVNGVSGVMEMLHDGDIVTVDGYLGIVTVGAPEFDLELADVVGGAGLRPPGGGA